MGLSQIIIEADTNGDKLTFIRFCVTLNHNAYDQKVMKRAIWVSKIIGIFCDSDVAELDKL